MPRPINRQLTPPKTPNKGRARVWIPSARAFVDLGPWGSEEAEKNFNRLAAEYVLNFGNHSCKMPTSFSMAEMMLGYLKSVSGRDVTFQSLVKTVAITISDAYGEIEAVEFGPVQFRAWGKNVVEQRDIGRSSSIKYRSVVLRAFKWAISSDLIKSGESRYADLVVTNPFADVTVARPKKVRPAKWEDVEKVAGYLTPTLSAALRTQLATGMRSAEMLSMRPMDIHRIGVVTLPTGDEIDLDAESKAAREAGVIGEGESIWLYAPAHHKTESKGSWRAIPIMPDVQELLTPRLNRESDKCIFSPKESFDEWNRAKRKARKTKVQPSQIDRSKKKPKWTPSGMYDPRAYRQAIVRACSRAGVEIFHPHQVRHAVSTRIAGPGGNLRDAQALLGHADIRTTQGYSRIQFAAAIAGAAKIRPGG